MITQRIRRAVRRLAPGVPLLVGAARYFATRRSVDDWTSIRVATHFGWRVASGPFVGMRYSRLSLGLRDLPAKILGCYEAELHQSVKAVVERAPRSIINIGAAEGYYAVGLAVRIPHALVLGFESDPVRRRLCRRHAALNGVADRIRLRGSCTTADLAKLPLESALIMCDVEGAELQILDPALIPSLASTELVVELHDGADARITPTLAERFRRSHDLQIISVRDRCPDRLPIDLSFLTAPERTTALQEHRRISRGWLVASPR